MQRRAVRPMRSQRTPENASFECEQCRNTFTLHTLTWILSINATSHKQSCKQTLHVPSFAKSLITFLFKVGEASIKTTTWGKLSNKKITCAEKLSVTQWSYKHYTFSEFQISLSIPQALPTARQVAVTPIPKVGPLTMVTVSTFNGLLQRAPTIGNCGAYSTFKGTKVSEDKSGSAMKMLLPHPKHVEGSTVPWSRHPTPKPQSSELIDDSTKLVKLKAPRIVFVTVVQTSKNPSMDLRTWIFWWSIRSNKVPALSSGHELGLWILKGQAPVQHPT